MERTPVRRLVPQSRPGAKRVTPLPGTKSVPERLEILCVLQISQQPNEVGYYVYPCFIDEEPETRGG